MNQMNLTDRISLLELCDREFPGGVAVEVGVAGGHFSKQILATWKTIGRLHLVDAWRHFTDGSYADACNLDQATQDLRYAQVVKDFEGNSKVQIWRELSLEAATTTPEQWCQFIYLDANHSTAAVRQDLDHWWIRLAPGGIIAGHDYEVGNGKGYGVKAAVDHFASEWDLKVHTTTQEYCRPEGIYGAGWEGCSFVIRKPS